MRTLLICSIALVALTVIVACQTHPAEPASRPGSRDTTETFTGTLEKGIVAIGGETTGWQLVGDGESGGIEVDVSKVQARAEALAGRRVTITGTMTHRRYVERGEVRVLVAERIEPSPPQ